jgi:hypothetical protein
MKPAFCLKGVTLFFLSFFLLTVTCAQVTILPYGSSWKYLDINSRPVGWETPGYDDAAWPSGNGELGYGDGDEITVVSHGGCSPIASCGPKYITTYFRKAITISNPGSFTNFTLNVLRDDGIVVYINGTERYSNNMPAGRLHSTLATAAAGDDGDTPQSTTLSSAFFSAGTNVIAVEIHQNSATSSDISFDLQLIGNDAFSAGLTRGPYLQMGGQTSLNIRWRTTAAENTRVEIGTAFGTYPTVFSNPANVTEHEISVTGLSADTKYWYRIGNSTNMGAPDPDKFFTTLPPGNTTRKVRVAVFGDCGRNDNSFQSLSLSRYQSHLAANSIDAADAMLLLGDNAYTNGTDAEYTSNFFNAYSSNILKNHKLYSAPGNHDYDNGAQPASRTLPYYLNFTMPTAGQLGGVASGTEAFYSYDIGDIHFLSLDSYGTESPGSTKLYDTTGAQVAWIKSDLAATTKKWVIAYWHHPPYTKGSHNSDSETDLRDIRENFIRILERNGVDMILCGHSHDYERSYLLRGYYKVNPGDPALTEANFNTATHTVTTSNGNYDGTANSCVYKTVSGKTNHGTVYVLSGSAGADGGVQSGYPHDAMGCTGCSHDDGGMFYFEVQENRLDAKFIRRDGVIADKFTILKDVDQTTNYSIVIGQSQTLTASWNGNYSWTPGGATTRSVNVTPPAVGTYNYSVTDQYGCITDQFTVQATNTLPVVLKDYTVNLRSGKVYVDWTTSAEINNRHFTIERSADASHFTGIGIVNSAGTATTDQTYHFTDAAPLDGVSYYRLVQFNSDGALTYYETRKITNKRGNEFYGEAWQPAPETVIAQVYSKNAERIQFSIVDLMGRIVRNEMWFLNEGSNNKTIRLKKGTYVMSWKKTTGETISHKIVIR